MSTLTTPRPAADAPKILIVDDEREIRRHLEKGLAERGFRVVAASNVAEARAKLADARIDLIVLDVMMPGGSGLDFCREVRARSVTPIILLTALGEEPDRIVGLEMGADDYVTKPFSTLELVARIKATLRRAAMSAADGGGAAAMRVAAFDGWRLDLSRRELVRSDGVLVDLTSGEFTLLAALVERAGRVLSRDALLDLTRGRDAEPFDRAIDVLVSRLRAKLDDPARAPRLIKTVHAAGYMFAATVSFTDTP